MSAREHYLTAPTTETDQEPTVTTATLHSVTCELPACCATTYTAATPERAQALHDQHHQPRPVPNRPDARTIRRHLKARGLGHLVPRVTSGRNYCHVEVELDEVPPAQGQLETEHNATAVAEALRELWSDGEQRVEVLYACKVLVRRNGWTFTTPADPQATVG